MLPESLSVQPESIYALLPVDAVLPEIVPPVRVTVVPEHARIPPPLPDEQVLFVIEPPLISKEPES